MSERRIEVKTHLVTYTCDSCGKGEMRSTGVMYPTHPPQHQHQCTSCGQRMIFHDAYPRTETDAAPLALLAATPIQNTGGQTTVTPTGD